MRLEPGTRIGPYEIVAPLGQGGMGDVYRARDTRLGREVAIKTLPADVAADPERRARFETEARAVAALSHPNILAIHDLGEEGGVTFTVAELVEGQTLRERLADGPLAPSRAAMLAAQVAQGLAAAHDRGIVHRDLKPENVMVTPEGRAKILDFGLARRDEPMSAGSRSLAPTVAASTQPGTVMGTVGYMAPEQVRGQVVDARADLFALGIVLHEMLAGRAPFLRESAADTMSAILREDPAPLSLCAPETPPALQRIVERCLEKQPVARFRTAADLAFALESLAHGSASGAQAAVESHASSPRFQRLTYRNGHISAARFTPDGASVVFGATWDGRPFEVFTSRIGSADSRGLGLPAGSLLAMSTSGEMALSLGFHHRSWMQPIGTLARASLAGGGVRPLQKDVIAADWSPDGKSMAVIRFRGNDCVLEYPPGKALFHSEGWLNRCRVSPDGTRVAFANHGRTGEGEADLCVVDRDGRVATLQRSIINFSGVVWSPSGDRVWCSGLDPANRHGIWSVGLDGAVHDVLMTATRISLHDLRPDGRALVSMDELRTSISLSDSADSPEVDLAWFDGSTACSFSADGEQLLFAEVAEAENPHYATYLRGVDGSPAVRLGEGIGRAVSVDGEWVIAITHTGRRGAVLYPTGFGETRELEFEGTGTLLWATFAPDGAHLFHVSQRPGESPALYRSTLEGGASELLWDQPMRFERFIGAPVSPDGERLALQGLDGRGFELAWRSGEARAIPGFGVNEIAVSYDTTDGALFVCNDDPLARVLVKLDLATGARTPWRALRLPDPRGVIYVGPPRIAPNGSRLAYTYLRLLNNLYVVEGLGE
ncbi:MAG: protein kinase [Candidatus Eisenbacteria bacterium]|uniref:non-specific serine/threonine protein kinase n=1 Tax=Eiseniibacteriota bacterium TaxID=2212470 RepID=A0A933W840_UNCEI|nr:protein kinase [Candidatus Eisenbacteria bacterium]